MGLVARQMENLYIMFKAIHVIIFDDTPLNVTSRNSDQTRDRFAFFVPNLIYIRKDEKNSANGGCGLRPQRLSNSRVHIGNIIKVHYTDLIADVSNILTTGSQRKVN